MNVVSQFGTIIPFLEEIKQVEGDRIFFSPISEGKWSSAAIVAHLYLWDQYIQNSRLPMMLAGDTLPSGQVDVQAINNDAQNFAHSGISKNELIDQFVNNRKILLEELAKADLQTAFTIGEHSYTLEKYLTGMVEHDEHHMKQMKDVYEHAKKSFIE
ncbi:DinB family protein [Bacillus sp. 1P10SD]|uniref:DinB family protein n=1 Tax=Bacillus sp. 1P10SD TaxID=3132265 RepID=UPI0039A70078